MKDGEQKYLDYLNDINNSIMDIDDFIANMNFDEFKIDRKTINAVVRSLEIIGEAAKRISDELKNKYDSIPWKEMAGMRDKLIHEYSGVDLEIVWETISNDLPKVKRVIERMLEDTK